MVKVLMTEWFLTSSTLTTFWQPHHSSVPFTTSILFIVIGVGAVWKYISFMSGCEKKKPKVIYLTDKNLISKNLNIITEYKIKAIFCCLVARIIWNKNVIFWLLLILYVYNIIMKTITYFFFIAIFSFLSIRLYIQIK